MKTKKKTKSQSPSSSEDEKKFDEQDLTNYAGNSIKLMTEIFKILGDKKLKQMVPSILKPIETNDLKAQLVEESMALSKKRVISILNGENYTSSSDESDHETNNKNKPEFDVISLDGISDDSDIFCFDDLPEADVLPDIKLEDNNRKKKKKNKKHPKNVIDEKAMTALELLELQARARAIKSQLALESVTSPIDTVEDVIKNEIKSEKHVDNSTEKPVRKVKLRRDHLRINPNRTTATTNNEVSKNLEVTIEAPQSEEILISEIKKERRASTDSLIVESPSHPLIVLEDSSEDDVNQKLNRSDNNSEFTEKENSLVNQCITNEVQNKDNNTNLSSESIEKDNLTEQSTNSIHNSDNEITSTNIITKSDEPNSTTTEIIQKKKQKHKKKKLNNELNSTETSNGEILHTTQDQDFIIIDSEPDFDSEPDDENLTENTTWKKRWLDSKKVKTVLQTSKLCNNMKRKISLKKESTNESTSTIKDNEVADQSVVTEHSEEGTIEHFNALKENNSSETNNSIVSNDI